MPRFIKDVDLWISINLFDHIGWLVQCICPFITCFWLARISAVVGAIGFALSISDAPAQTIAFLGAALVAGLWKLFQFTRAIETTVSRNPTRMNSLKSRSDVRLVIVAFAVINLIENGTSSLGIIMGNIGLVSTFYFMAGNPMTLPPKEAPHPLTIAEPPDSPP